MSDGTIEYVEQSDIGDALLQLIRPYYKKLHSFGDSPEFKKSMNGNDVEKLLISIHNIVLQLRKEDFDK